MSRGQTAEVGDTYTAANGYHYTKVAQGQTGSAWRLTHHITAEKMLGRALRDDEMVKFVDKKYKRDPTNPQGIRIIKKRTTSLRRRKAAIETRIEDLQEELKYINEQLDKL